mmetsp:Transcript_35513/g.98269  ORF Transcript_35513/g.98269 Transcript_35513/m.98269 type:complete len:215 (+) Transcript_35513:1326-1970(+)
MSTLFTAPNWAKYAWTSSSVAVFGMPATKTLASSRSSAAFALQPLPAASPLSGLPPQALPPAPLPLPPFSGARAARGTDGEAAPPACGARAPGGSAALIAGVMTPRVFVSSSEAAGALRAGCCPAAAGTVAAAITPPLPPLPPPLAAQAQPSPLWWRSSALACFTSTCLGPMKCGKPQLSTCQRASSSAKVTKAKPRELPVNWSLFTSTEVTWP